MKYKRITCISLCIAILLTGFSLTAFARVLGDRAVLSINNVTYTQRQVELYIVIKESLRRNTAIESARVVTASNWREALTVFTEDMIVYQESLRLGGLQAADQLIDRFATLIKEKNEKSPLFRSTMSRLGADQIGITHVLDSVIRVAAFRRSKDRQATTAAADVEELDDGVKPSWLSDLEARSIVRRYEGAEQFIAIAPTTGGAAIGK